MSLSIISEELEQITQKENNSIIQEFDKIKLGLQKDFDKRINEFQNKLKLMSTKELEKKHLQIIGQSKKEAKTINLRTKTLLIELLFQQIFVELKNSSSNLKKNLYKKVIEKTSQIMSIDIVYTSDDDKHLVERLIPKNSKLLCKNELIGLGFESLDKKIYVDASLHNILKSIFEEKEDLIQKVLFDM